MDKLYSKEKDWCQELRPKQKTIDFLLCYSKSVKIVHTKKRKYKIHLN